MRPIDADKLIEEVRDWVDVSVLTFINNAPTVEVYTKDDMTKEYLKGYNDCKEMTERPAGKWVLEDELNHTYRCSVCNELSCCKGSFCPDCGADMRGDKHEDN